MKQMTIHEALSTLKVLDKRIQAAASAEFVVANRHNNEKINGVSVDDKKTELKANLQKYKDLVANRRTLKSAIAMSNANTKITISGKEYTIVEAIEEKSFASARLNYLNLMKRHLNIVQNTVNSKNDTLPEYADKYVASLLGADKNSRPVEEIKKMREDYMTQNVYDLIDPNNLASFISDEELAVSDFLNNIDFKLSESNATTVISVELLGE